MSILSWVRGNSVLMTVTLIQKKTDGTEENIDLSGYDAWECKVWGLTSYRRDAADVTAALDQSGHVVLSIPATLPRGTYSVEVVCEKDGYGRRSYEVPVFSVVESNGEAHVTYDVVECQLSADIEMEFQLVPTAGMLGKNAYEMWKELPGNEGKTLQDYIDEVLDLNTITAACVAATEAAEEAASHVGNPDYIGDDNYVYHWDGEQYVKTDIYVKGDTGETGATGATGAPGADGADGADGVGISSITFKQTDAQGNNIYTITLTNGNSYDFTAPKGAQGNDGADGARGADGQDGSDGQDGQDGVGIDDIEFKETDAQGNNVYTITLTNGSEYDFTAPKGAPGAAGASAWGDITGKPTTIAGYGITDAKIESGTITLGNDTITPLTSHQDISGKADKVSSATNGNFAALDSNGNLTDSGHKHSDYLTSHQDLSNYVQKSNTSGLLKNDGTVDTNTYLTSAHEVPAGGNAGQVLKKTTGTDYDYAWANPTQDYPSAYCKTAAGTASKTAACTLWTATANTYLHLVIVYANTSASALTLNVNSTGAKPIYINGSASSSSNYTLPAGSYIIFYDGTNYYFRTDGKIQGLQPTLATQTAYTSKGTATKVPQITTNTLGQVTGITEVTISVVGTLNTNNSTAQTVSSSESFGGTINLHKVSKTGSYNDLLNKPTIPAAQVQSDWNATTGMGAILNKPTIPTVPTNVSAFNNDAGYLTSHQDITGKEDKMGIITVSATSLAPSINKYYRFTSDVGTLAVTLPTVTDTTKVASIVFYLTTGASPNVTFTSSHSVVYQDGFQLDASKTYEVNALFNGAAWVLMAAEINTGS